MRKQRVNHIWHDDWIREHLFSFPSYREAAVAYNRQFNVIISMEALKNHCKYTLKIDKPRGSNYRHISEEQSEWFKSVYSKIGAIETWKLWNEKYNDDATYTCIKNIARKLGVTVDEDVAIANKLKAVRRKGSKRALRNPGDTRLECGRLVMKAEDGSWKSAGRCVWEKAYGKIPEGYALIALDGDTSNIELSNFEIVPWHYLGKLSRNDFFSSNPEITKAGVIWCDLEALLNSEEKIDSQKKQGILQKGGK